MNLNDNGHLSPGDPLINNGIGTLTIGGTGSLVMSGSSILDWDLGSSTSSCDNVVLSGSDKVLVLDGTMNIHYANGSSCPSGNYLIFSGASYILDNGLLFGDCPVDHNWSYYVSGGNVYLTAAPEPGTLMLLAFAGLSLIVYLRKKRHTPRQQRCHL